MSHLTKSKKDKEHASSNKQKDKKTKNPKHNFHKDDSDDDDIYETCSDSYNEDDDLDSEEDDDEDSEEDEDEDEEDEDEDEEKEEDDEREKKRQRLSKSSSSKINNSNSNKSKEEEFSKSAFKKAFMALLPSSSSSSEPPRKKHKKNRKNTSDTESEEDDHKYKKKSKHVKKNTKKTEKSKNKKEEEEDDSDDSDFIDEDGSSDDDDDDILDNEYLDQDSGMKTLNFILSMGEGMNTSVDEEYEQILKEDKHEICNSDDEKTFMKETYLPIHIPENTNEITTNTSSSGSEQNKIDKKKIKHNKKIRNTLLSSEKEKPKKKDIMEELSEHDNKVTKKYIELTQLKKDLTEQLEKKPNSKILRNAIQECCDSISKLIKKARNKNTKEYYKLVNGDEEEKQNNGELSYFKKKCSHKEQLKIMRDLKEINAFTNVDKPYRLSLLESNIPAKYKAVVLQKLKILRTMEPGDSEYFKLKNWVDGFMRVPFGKYKQLSVNLNDGLDACHSFIENAKNTLDNCTYGLNDAKLQILQMVGQWIANPGAIGTSIAIHGPPGTGKTTIVKDGISKILGREFAFIALGGAGDSSFLEGHSYTYEGSSWGKIIQILMDSKCMNPVIYFDELDKISETPRGEEITNILVHLTDVTQNDEYHDKYFSEVSFRLSQCLFIFSYNDETKINPVLKDRMYRIHTKGYDAKEKVIIARKHLLPKIREQVNFKEGDIDIPDETLNYIITNDRFCKGEQGVRNLKRCLEIIHTKLNLFRLIKSDVKLFEKDINLGDEVVFPFVVTKKHVDILIKSEEPLNHSMLAMYV
jgi:ATP-dependent Lon protease